VEELTTSKEASAVADRLVRLVGVRDGAGCEGFRDVCPNSNPGEEKTSNVGDLNGFRD